MGMSLPPVVSNIFMGHFAKMALDTAQNSLWLRYVDDTVVVWPHGLNRLQSSSIISVAKTFIQFTMEIESYGTLPFLDVLVTKKGLELTTRVYRKLAHNGCYLHFQSNHPPHVKKGVVHSLHSRASTIC
jgi:hypothetical protein